MPPHRPFHIGCPDPEQCRIDRRALSLWPRLDRRALARCHHDPACVVRLVGRRTSLPPTAVWSLLTAPLISATESETWFG